MSVNFPVPTLGLGAAPLGATGSDPFAVRSASLAQDTVRHCLARDIRFFDTAPLYGAGVGADCGLHISHFTFHISQCKEMLKYRCVQRRGHSCDVHLMVTM